MSFLKLILSNLRNIIPSVTVAKPQQSLPIPDDNSEVNIDSLSEKPVIYMTTSAAGLDLIKRFEGFSATSYADPIGVMTIGYGTTTDVYPGMKITEEEAEVLMRRDLYHFELAINNAVKVEITQGMFDALSCFTYNVGSGNLNKSTLLKLINANKFQEAANEFPKWNKAGGKVLAGLTRRRLAEQQLFLSSIP